jgi:hypothetical protein
MDEEPGKPSDSRSRGVILFLASVAILLLYLAAYGLMLDETGQGGTVYDRATSISGMRYYKRIDKYRFGEETSRAFFWPANQLDRLVRSHAWIDPNGETW